MKFVIANESHESGLRHVTASIHMPGRVVLSYQREPNYFYGASVQGKKHQTIAGIKDKVVGYGCRNIKPMYINGSPKSFGYLSGLRALPEVRGGRVLYSGYKFLKKLHADQETPAYITTIIDDNLYAKSILTSSRFDLPTYTDWGQYFTYAINLNRHKKKHKNKDISIKRGAEIEMKRIISFLNETGSKHQFYPVYEEGDFGTDYTRGFSPSDFYIAVKGEQIQGIVGAWDQSAFKQNIIIQYNGSLRIIRTMVNLGLLACGYHALPAPGQELKMLYAAFVCIDLDDPKILAELLNALCNDYGTSDYHFICIGLHETDPLNEALRHFSTFRYNSRLYVVSWQDGDLFCQKLEKSKIPYLELATL